MTHGVDGQTGEALDVGNRVGWGVPPMSPPSVLVTRLLHRAAREPQALDDVFPVVYEELRQLAHRIRHSGSSATLDTTGVVHEAYLKLVGVEVDWQGRQHFFRVAARAMRQVLVSDARRRQADKRGGGAPAITLVDDLHGTSLDDHQLLGLHDALGRLSGLDPRQAEVVELRFFAGLTIDEVAGVLDVSSPTVNRAWRLARVWLARELASHG